MAFIPTAQRNRAADAVCVRANSGTLVIYGGTVPANADAALVGGNTAGATLGMSATAFGAAVNVDPTALKTFSIANPISSMSFTPSNWTAGVSIQATVMAESSIVYQDCG